MSETPPKQPGSAEPVPGKCGAKLRSKPDDEVSRVGRFCTRPAGWGTPHAGTGACKLHGGSTQSAIVAANRTIVATEARTIAERLGEPEPVGEPMVELFRMASQVKQMNQISIELLGELETFDTEDRQGVERIKPMVEFWERSADRAIMVYEKLMKLGLMQYKVTLAQEHANMLANVIIGVVHSHEMGLTQDQIDTAKRLIGVEVTKLGASLQPDWLTNLPDEDEDDDEIHDAVIV